MGFLRLLLAAAVVAEHSTSFFGLTLTGGHLAVRLFFMISGFYMALILGKKYTTATPNRYWLFITNRFSRIYPCYFVILFLSLAFYAAASFHLHHPADRLILWQAAWQHGERWKLLWLGMTQFTVVGLESACFFVYDAVRGIHLVDAATAGASVAWLPGSGVDAGAVPAWRFLFVPQAWSISIELLFYLCAPRLVSCKTKTLLIISAASVAGYFAGQHFLDAGVFKTVSYFFFPFHLPLFIGGILAYRFSREYLDRVARWFRIAVVAGLFAVLFACQFMPEECRGIVCYVLLFLALPVLFDATKNNAASRWLGDLSYPIYICHILMKWILLALAGVSKIGVTSPPGWLLLLCSTVFAALLLRFVDHPIDKWRQGRVLRSTKGLDATSSARAIVS